MRAIPRPWLFRFWFWCYFAYWYALAPHVRQDSPRLRWLFVQCLRYVDVWYDPAAVDEGIELPIPTTEAP